MKQGVFAVLLVVVGVVYCVGTTEALAQNGTIGNETLLHNSIVIRCKANYARLSMEEMEFIEGELLKVHPGKEEEIKIFVRRVKVDDITGPNCTNYTSLMNETVGPSGSTPPTTVPPSTMPSSAPTSTNGSTTTEAPSSTPTDSPVEEPTKPTSDPGIPPSSNITTTSKPTTTSSTNATTTTGTTAKTDTPKTQPQPDDGSNHLAWSIPLISIALIAMLIGGYFIFRYTKRSGYLQQPGKSTIRGESVKKTTEGV